MSFETDYQSGYQINLALFQASMLETYKILCVIGVEAYHSELKNKTLPSSRTLDGVEVGLIRDPAGLSAAEIEPRFDQRLLAFAIILLIHVNEKERCSHLEINQRFLPCEIPHRSAK